MQHGLIPPREPGSIRPPMIYFERGLKWEYKQIVRNLETEKPLDETELNVFGEDGWELVGTVQQPPFTCFYNALGQKLRFPPSKWAQFLTVKGILQTPERAVRTA